MKLSGKNVLVVGTGLSGLAATKLLLGVGANPILFDENKDVDIERVKENLGDSADVKIIVGEVPEEVFGILDLAVLSPGVPLDAPFSLSLKDRRVKIIGEIELSYLCGKGGLLAITGTNGKTTTTALLGQIMQNAYADAYVVGNIGIPYSKIAADTTEESVTVAEISSFQLETIDTFKPHVTAVLNITPDHLNRHHTMENYILAKLAIAANQTEEDFCILNYEDDELRERANTIAAKKVFFSSLTRLDEGIYLDGEDIIYNDGNEKIKVINIHDLNILGRHNHENVMAASAMAICYGVSLDIIQKTLKEFTAVEHRIEFVCDKKGIRFYNDSKGTNPDAAIKAIQAMNRPTCLIGGGYDKNSEYKEWIQSFDGKVKKLVLIGQTREKIAADCEACGFKDYEFAETLQEAVDKCYEYATTGDAVLLSPACASWGMFPNYEVRGRMFKDMVHALKE